MISTRWIFESELIGELIQSNARVDGFDAAAMMMALSQFSELASGPARFLLSKTLQHVLVKEGRRRSEKKRR